MEEGEGILGTGVMTAVRHTFMNGHTDRKVYRRAILHAQWLKRRSLSRNVIVMERRLGS